MRSRVKGDFHARFCGKAGVKFLCLTRLVATAEKANTHIQALREKRIYITKNHLTMKKTKTRQEVANEYGFSRSTFYRLLRELHPLVLSLLPQN